MKTIEESGAQFGPYDEKALFHIEKSSIYGKLGDGVKTVEFIVKSHDKSLVFLEAKTSCPNPHNKAESRDKGEAFEKFYRKVVQKFVDSLQILTALVLKRHQDDEDEVGIGIKENTDFSKVKLKFVLVITSDGFDVSWLDGPREELKARMKDMRKIWGLDIVVLNRDLAREHGLLI